MSAERPGGGSIGRVAALLCALVAMLTLAVAPARANRTLQSEEVLHPSPEKHAPPPDGQVEGACGLALSPGSIYVSDYYHRAVDIFSNLGAYSSRLALPGENPVFGVNTLDAVCGLALDSGGRLYANEWHEGVLRLTPSEFSIDEGESTGVAVDGAGNVYVDDREYVAEYEAPVEPEDKPVAKIGVENLGDAYGVAVSAGRVYVPDASTDTVKVFEPTVDLKTPVATISHGFKSLVDAAVAVDPSNGHLLVVDNAQPGFEHPKAAIYEFESSGTFLGKLPGSPVDGGPSGIAAASDGTLYVTDGNSELSNVYEYSPYSASIPGEAGPSPEGGATQPAAAGVGSSPLDLSAGPAPARPAPTSRPVRASHSAHASGGQTQLVQNGPIRVAVSGSLAPKRLPRKGVAPITVTIGGRISSTEPDTPPQLRKVTFAFNRAGQLDRRGLPVCGLSDIDPTTTRQALLACRSSLVGEGLFTAKVRLPEQSPFPSNGKVLAFNGTLKGKPVIFAHIYGTKPVPTSVVLPLAISQHKGTFGTRLDASLAELTGDWGYVTGISLKLGRRYHAHGERRSFLSAGCPAPKGFPGALFALARTTFSFVGGRSLSATLTRNCKVRG
jgi:hypothetical protein